MSLDTYDVIIIGAGIVGACTAYELSKKGYKTLNVDKNPAVGYGSTSSSCAIIRTFYSTQDASAMAFEGYYYWTKWADYLGRPDDDGLVTYKDTGCLIYKTASNNYLKTVGPIMDAIKCPYEHLSAEQIKQRLPIINSARYEPVKHVEDDGFADPTGDELLGGIYFPVGGYISDPQQATNNVKDVVVAMGGQFKLNSEVVKILQHGGSVKGIALKDGSEICAPIVINISGPHSGKINALAGKGGNTLIKTRPCRQEVASLNAPEGFDFGEYGPFCIDADVGSYSRPETGNRMLIGTVQPPCDEIDWADADDFDTNISEQLTTQVMRQAQRYQGMQIPASINGIVALYDVSDDWNPIYDKSDLPGYYMAIGTSGNQFKNAPLAGKIMTQIIENCEAGNDHDVSPTSMELTNIGWTLPLGIFSRNRKINKDSSFSVLG